MAWNSFTGLMARRLLVNWRVPLHIAARVLPAGLYGLRPKAVGGWAIAGLCLVRLEQLRPTALPATLGVASENLAIRMGIEWETAAGSKSAVLIFRRETASAVNGFFAARVGYGIHNRSNFRVDDDGQIVDIATTTRSDGHAARVRVKAAESVTPGSVFRSIEDARDYFCGGECGYSRGRRQGTWRGARLHMHRWELEPMRVEAAHSSYLEKLFAGEARIDSAFIMRDITHTWSPCGAEHFGIAPALRANRRVLAA